MEGRRLHTEITANLEQFNWLYQQYHQAVYANICKMVQHPESAEDILQEVFISLWNHLEGLEKENIAGWLFVVSYNKAASYLRKKLRETAVLSTTVQLPDIAASEPQDEALYQLKLSMVQEAARHLPPRKEEVFRLCRLEGRSADEVADLLCISVASVKDYLKQSTRFIKDYIHAHYPHLEEVAAPLLILYFSCH